MLLIDIKGHDETTFAIHRTILEQLGGQIYIIIIRIEYNNMKYEDYAKSLFVK
jgi:hypothetical protein